jgi:hypothetical protein
VLTGGGWAVSPIRGVCAERGCQPAFRRVFAEEFRNHARYSFDHDTPARPGAGPRRAERRVPVLRPGDGSPLRRGQCRSAHQWHLDPVHGRGGRRHRRVRLPFRADQLHRRGQWLGHRPPGALRPDHRQRGEQRLAGAGGVLQRDRLGFFPGAVERELQHHRPECLHHRLRPDGLPADQPLQGRR